MNPDSESGCGPSQGDSGAGGLGGDQAQTDHRSGTGGTPPPILVSAPNDHDDNCCICLSPIVNRCTTKGCRHHFCYQCLLTWSQTKAECPLCKSKFTSISYNYNLVNGVEVHDEFEVPPPPTPTDHSPISTNGLRRLGSRIQRIAESVRSLVASMDSQNAQIYRIHRLILELQNRNNSLDVGAPTIATTDAPQITVADQTPSASAAPNQRSNNGDFEVPLPPRLSAESEIRVARFVSNLERFSDIYIFSASSNGRGGGARQEQPVHGSDESRNLSVTDETGSSSTAVDASSSSTPSNIAPMANAPSQRQCPSIINHPDSLLSIPARITPEVMEAMEPQSVIPERTGDESAQTIVQPVGRIELIELTENRRGESPNSSTSARAVNGKKTTGAVRKRQNPERQKNGSDEGRLNRKRLASAYSGPATRSRSRAQAEMMTINNMPRQASQVPNLLEVELAENGINEGAAGNGQGSDGGNMENNNYMFEPA